MSEFRKKKKRGKKKKKGTSLANKEIKKFRSRKFDGTPTASKICDAYGIELNTLRSFLAQKGLFIKDSEEPIFESDILIDIHSAFKIWREHYDKTNNCKTYVEFIDKNLSPLNLDVPIPDPVLPGCDQFDKPENICVELKEKVKVLPLEGNLFEKIKTEISYKNLPKFYSNFTDLEALNICRKMTSSFTRKLCLEYDRVNSNRNEILYQLHYIANKALGIYGGRLLTFIYSLRRINYKYLGDAEVSKYFNVLPDFPLLKFNTIRGSIEFSFFNYKCSKTNKIIPDLRSYIENRSSIEAIDINGYIIKRLELVNPKFQFFLSYLKSGQFTFTSGVETGICDNCKRELRHPISIRIGIGPICARNLGINWSSF